MSDLDLRLTARLKMTSFYLQLLQIGRLLYGLESTKLETSWSFSAGTTSSSEYPL